MQLLFSLFLNKQRNDREYNNLFHEVYTQAKQIDVIQSPFLMLKYPSYQKAHPIFWKKD